jgi:hypothetical protein
MKTMRVWQDRVIASGASNEGVSCFLCGKANIPLMIR